MTIELPEAFLRRMKEMLGEDYNAFVASYGEDRTHGLRLNTRKVPLDSAEADKLRAQFQLEPVPWCKAGYYYAEEAKPGRHPYHAAGVYYIQEPSAMSAAEMLAPQPGEIVLDLAAAPGGKSTHIADLMQGQGLLVANEIHPGRAAILSENIERMGIQHAVVTNASPGQLAERFPHYFDRILVDAPCSGEGMFRKDPQAVLEWSEQQVAVCAARQFDILQDAMKMLKPGGTLVYSTCTFAEEENEEIIDRLCGEYPHMERITMERFWPHRHRGEGHFVAVLRDRREEEAPLELGPAAAAGPKRRDKMQRSKHSSRAAQGSAEAAMRLFHAFAAEQLPNFTLPEGEPILFGEQLYWLPVCGGKMSADLLQGLRVPRPGLHLGLVRKQRFEPSHALALALKPDEAERVHHLTAEDSETEAYLRGETLPIGAGMKGWTLVAVDGYPLGWGKAGGGMLKNHYPKGLRRPY